MDSSSRQIRFANVHDASLVLEFVREIAEYEGLSEEVEATEIALRDALFGERPEAEVLLCFEGGQAAAFAVFYHNFSTFLGRRGLYLEDLFVRPSFRGRGIGKELFRRLAQVAHERNCARFEWMVLNWNEPAIEFYRRSGAAPLNEWTTFRMNEESLRRVSAVER